MCGLVAIACLEDNFVYGSNNQITTLFEEQLFGTSLRGEDSTGIFLVNDQNRVDIFKRPIPSFALLRDTGYQKFERKMGSVKYAVGHCRAATRGEISYDNAHPFVYKHIHLVHNGVMRNTSDFKDINYAVDSNYIAHLLAEHKTPKEVFAQIEGDFALIWYDKEEKSFNFVRNHARPLHFLPYKGRIFFISEPELLFWVMRRNKITDFNYEDIKEVPANKAFKITQKDKPVIHEEEIEFKKPHVSNTSPVYGMGFHNTYYDRMYDTKYGSEAKNKEKEAIYEKLGIYPDQKVKFYLSDLTTPPNVSKATDETKGDLIGHALTKNKADVAVVKGYSIPHSFLKFNDEVESYAYENIQSNEEAYVLSAKVISVWKEREHYVVLISGDEITGTIKNEDGTFECKFYGKNGTIVRKRITETLHLPDQSKSKEDPLGKETQDMVPGPNNILITKGAWAHLTEDGCTRCFSTLSVDDAESIKWVQIESDFYPYCSNCNPLNISRIH